MANRPIAITGATGFVGSHLVGRLVEQGHAVRILARRPETVRRNDVEVIAGDLASHEALERLCADAQSVVHCAGVISAPSRAAYDLVNVAGTHAVLEAAKAAGVRRFVHLSSLAAREPDVSGYAASKRAGEEPVCDAGTAFSWVVLRPPAVYGPGDKATLPLIKQLTQRIALVPGTNAGRASLIHVRDLADAIVHVVEHDELSGAVFELDDGKEGGYSWRELTCAAGEAEGHKVACVFLPRSVARLAGAVEAALARRANRTPEVTPDKVRELYHPDWVCRHNLLQERSTWHPAVGLVDGLRETASWYRKEGWL